MRRLLTAMVLMLAVTLPVLADEFKNEFKNYCTTGLAHGKVVKTDCSVHEKYQGKNYCFGDRAAKREFNHDRAGTLAKAEKFYSTLKE